MATKKKPTKGVYKPSDEQLTNQKRDRRNIDADLRYRSKFEPRWLSNVEKWNLVAPPGMEGTPNYVVPISRMATHTGVVSMRQSLPEIIPVPEGSDEKKLGYIIQQASNHVHRMSNMEGVMDYAIVDFSVIGNMVLQSFVDVPYKARRVPKLDAKNKPVKGQYETVYQRDWSRPKIGTKARSVWECAFDKGARTPDKIRRCWFQDRVSEEEFDELFRNKPDHDYINLDLVEPGFVWTFANNGDLERTEADHDGIALDNVQNELEDAWRIYANGILIWDVPLSSVHCHGKITLSLIPNHHKYDDNRKTHALYGTGDPELLADLDDLINAVTNMFVLNYRNKNTYVVGIEGGVDVDEIDFSSGQPIHGRVSVQSLGQADLPEWQVFKNELENWAIQLVKKNWKRLEGEVAKTAYEAAQKKSDENKGMEYQAKRMESGGFLEYVRKHVSDCMEHLVVEEWEDILDEDRKTIQAMLKEGEIDRSDVVCVRKSGKLVPVKVRYVEQIRTQGRVFKENRKKGRRSLEYLQEVKTKRGQDGWLSASEEYLHTRKWKLFKKVPDIYLVGKTILGQEDLMELGKIEQLLGSLERIAKLQQEGFFDSMGLDAKKLSDMVFDRVKIRREQLTKSEGDERIDRAHEAVKKAKLMKTAFLTPTPNAQDVSAPVSGGAPDAGGRPAPQAPQAQHPLALGGAAGGAGPARPPAGNRRPR